MGLPKQTIQLPTASTATCFPVSRRQKNPAHPSATPSRRQIPKAPGATRGIPRGQNNTQAPRAAPSKLRPRGDLSLPSARARRVQRDRAGGGHVTGCVRGPRPAVTLHTACALSVSLLRARTRPPARPEKARLFRASRTRFCRCSRFVGTWLIFFFGDSKTR